MGDDRERDRDRDRDRDRHEEVNELIDDELKALDGVMEALERLDVASRMRVLRAAEALLPPATTPIPTPR